MVLNSQTPRAGMSRMYMSSKPRSGVKWGWLALIGIALVSMYIFVWPHGDDGQAGESGMLPAAAEAGQPASNATIALAETQDAGRPNSVRDLPPPRDLTRSNTPDPVVQTIRVGETRNTPLTSSPPVPRTGSPAARPGRTATTSGTSGSQLSRGMNMIREGRLVQGRRELSQLLLTDDGGLSALDAQTVRDTLASINKQLVFSDQVVPGDSLAESYVVQRGDYLSVIAPRYGVPYQFIEQINNTPAERLQAGKPIKLIKGPFHARISKRDFRIDLYLNDTDGQPLYIRSFTIGLGKDDATPMGAFIVSPGSKVANPSWRNPRTGEFFGKNDPKNPIGEYWLALKGTDAQTESLTGYGIHGTIDPSSIGREASMGCVRLQDKDIELVYDMLASGQSTVVISW
jgi:LysM repeat protein